MREPQIDCDRSTILQKSGNPQPLTRIIHAFCVIRHKIIIDREISHYGKKHRETSARRESEGQQSKTLACASRLVTLHFDQKATRIRKSF
jgi:hypothetical protein